MKVTRAGEYAIRCILYMARRDGMEAHSRRDIAATMEIPFEFLGKIARDLAKAGLMDIAQGAKGGYRLARTPDRITVLDVLEAVEGEILLSSCLVGPGFCSNSSRCAVHQVWAEARQQLRGNLGAKSFADLVDDERQINATRPPCGHGD